MSNEMSAPAQIASRASDQKFCHSCAMVIHMSASMCPKCGAHQQSSAPVSMGQVVQAPAPAPVPAVASMPPPQRTTADQRHCHGCGNIIHASAPTCPQCGAQQFRDQASSQFSGGVTKSRVTAAVLAFLLGGLGVHKFYCGKIGFGFLYLIFFWTWIPALVALVEGVIFLTGASTDEEFTRKYCA